MRKWIQIFMNLILWNSFIERWGKENFSQPNTSTYPKGFRSRNSFLWVDHNWMNFSSGLSRRKRKKKDGRIFSCVKIYIDSSNGLVAKFELEFDEIYH